MADQSNRSPRLAIVVGGGIVGLSASRVLARSGHRVTLLEKSKVGGEASWAAAGMLIPLAESDPGPFRELALASFALYVPWVRTLEAETGRAVGYQRTGQLSYARTEERLVRLRARFETLPEPTHATWVDGAGARRLEPALAEGVLGGIHFPADAHVDNRRLVPALLASAVSAGVEVREDTEVARIEPLASGAVAVLTTDGERLTAERVVVAAGAWSARIGGLHPQLEVRPVRGQMLALRCGSPGPLRGLIDGEDVYMIPRDGRVLVGGTKEDRGFDRTVDPKTQQRQVSAATRAIPALSSATLDETWIGFRPHTPDAMPLLGWDPEIPNLFYATGHYRNGILLTPITEQVIEAAFRGQTHPLAKPFGWRT